MSRINYNNILIKNGEFILSNFELLGKEGANHNFNISPTCFVKPTLWQAFQN